MLDLVDNEAVVLAVLGDRYRLPVERLVPGEVAVAEAPHPGMPVCALARGGGAVVAVEPAWSGLLGQHLDGPASLGAALTAVAGAAGGQHFSWVARTGVAIPARRSRSRCWTPPTRGCRSGSSATQRRGLGWS